MGGSVKIKTPACSWLNNVGLDNFIAQVKSLPPAIAEHVDNKEEINQELKNMPQFTFVFDELAELLGKLPTQDLYAGYYLSKAKEVNITPEIYRRARRNYFSFLREYHFYVTFKCFFPRNEIIFSRELDNCGIDFLIVGKKEKYAICCYLASYNSYVQLARKRTIHFNTGSYNGLLGKIVDLPLNRDNSYSINGYWLYKEDYVKNFVGGLLN